MLELHFQVATITHLRLEIIGELVNYKSHVFYHLLARGRANIKLGDADACKIHP
jgi:hypothetical protein